MTRHQSAAASSNPSLPNLSRSVFIAVPARWLTAASQRAGILRDRFAAWCKDTFGPLEFEVSDRRRGYLKGLRCDVCRCAAHDTGEMCPRQMSGDCSVCGHRVLLDYFGNCASDARAYRRGHVISNRRAATTSEWRRPQRIVKARSPAPQE